MRIAMAMEMRMRMGMRKGNITVAAGNALSCQQAKQTTNF